MSKFKVGQRVIQLNTIIPQRMVIAEVVPKRWWHIQQRYLVDSALPRHYDYHKEKNLMAVTKKGKHEQ